MRTAHLAWVLGLALPALAQEAPPAPELAVAVNDAGQPALAPGWPLILTATVMSSDGRPLSLALNGKSWGEAFRIEVADGAGRPVSVPWRLIAARPDPLALNDEAAGNAVWVAAPEATASWQPGVYTVSVLLDTNSGAETGAWSGKLSARPVPLQVQAEAPSPTPETDATKSLLRGRYELLSGNLDLALEVLNGLVQRQPTLMPAYAVRGDVEFAARRWGDAMTDYGKAVEVFEAAHPGDPHSPRVLEAKYDQAAALTAAAENLGVDSVVNAASFQPPIAPGSFFTVFGHSFTDQTLVWDAAIPDGKTLPATLGGVKVRLSGRDCFLYYASPAQLNVLAPPDVAPGSVSVEVITAAGTSTATATVQPVAPAFFTYPLSGRLYVSALIANSTIYVARSGALQGVTSRPARAGDYLQLYANGLGPTNPPYPGGQVLATAYPVSDLSRISVTVGGLPAPVLFAGMTYAGLYQVNIQVPAGVAAGDQPVTLKVADQATQANALLVFE